MKTFRQACLAVLGIVLISFSASARAYYADTGALYDESGGEIKLHGVNWFGFETDNHVPHGLWTRNWKSMIEQIKGLGFNAVRLPVCPATLRGTGPSSIDYYRNPELAGLDSLELLDAFMAEFDRQGIYVLLDHHRPDCAAISELWYTGSYSEEDWINDLVFLAERYAGNAHLVGIDLKNEPHGSATWGTGNPATDWDGAVETAATAVLAANPGILIFAGGIQENPLCSGTVNHWWGGNLEPYRCFPLAVPTGKLVLSPHVYGPDVYNQPYFDEPDFPENLPAIWEAHFGYLVDEGLPVIPGEFGGRYGHGGDPKDRDWQDALIDYFLAKGIDSFFYWSWNPNSGDTGGILQDDWTNVWEDKLILLERLISWDTPPAPTPTPMPSPVPAATSSPASTALPPAGFPERTFAPYVDVCIYPRFFITEMNEAMGTRYYTLAFIVSANDGSGRPTWGGYLEYSIEGDWYQSEIDGIRARGGDVIISLGGAAGTELALAHDNVESLRAVYQEVIDRYQLKWVDFDIEGAAVAHSESIDRRNKAIKLLQDDNPNLKVAYCLPVLPSGLTRDGVNLLQNAIDNGVRVDVVNIMAMDYGDWAAPDPEGRMGEYAIQAAESLFSQLQALYPSKTDNELWRMVGVTPMIGRNDVLTEVFDLEDAVQLLDFARQKNINMISMWSANRDNGSCGASPWSSPLCSSLEQEDYAFSVVFEGISGPIPIPMPTQVPAVTPTATPSPLATSSPLPTAMPAATPTPGPTSEAGLKVQYRAFDLRPDDNQIMVHFQIVNTGAAAVPLSELTTRYWYTIDGERPQNFWCDWAAVGGEYVSGTFQPLGGPLEEADYYLEVAFASGAGMIAAGSESGDVQCRFAKDDWTDYDETDDYSYDPSKTSYSDWERLTLYRNGSLIWGEEPGGMVSPTPEPSPTPLLSPTPSLIPTAIPISTVTPTPSSIPAASPTRTPASSPSAAPTATPSPSATSSPLPTAMPAATPTPGPTSEGGLKVRYRAFDLRPDDNQIMVHFKVVNTGAAAVPLSELTARYWYTIDGEKPQNFWCDWAAVGREYVSGTFQPLGRPPAGADYCLEIAFESGAGMIAAGGESGDVQCRFAKDDWTDYDETDDYSYDPSKTSYSDWERLTLYRNGSLIWGEEPGGMVSPTPTAIPISDTRPVIASGDYDGDGASDIAVFRPSTGLWSVKDLTSCHFGEAGDIPAPGDYDGDGTAEIAVFRSSQGLWSVRGGERYYYGGEGDIPVPGDYDGDLTDEIGVFRPSTGEWLVMDLTRVTYGGSGDEPLPGDYDGDGTEDPAIFRPASGLWAVRGLTRFYYGEDADTNIPGDYDGDGTWEAAIYRRPSRLWAVRGVTRIYFGGPLDRPVPADYDGDDRDDIGIFRDSSGLWAVNGITRVYCGSSGDLPMTR